jgi:hypothetical protein
MIKIFTHRFIACRIAALRPAKAGLFVAIALSATAPLVSWVTICPTHLVHSKMPDAISLSVVLATIEPWPDLANCLAVLEPQVAAVGGEIIVGDGHGEALDPRIVAKSDRIRWIQSPGASVFDLRARGAESARGEFVALTEDHCLVGADWCAQIIRAFNEHPEAMAVTGPVLNGSPEKLIDWANFLHTFGCYFPPVKQSQRDRCPPAANVAFRRSAIGDGAIAPGWLELELGPKLFFEGRVHLHDAITVTHVQSHGFWPTLLAHFDNGRSTTGLSPTRVAARQVHTPWNLYEHSVRSIGGDPRTTPELRTARPLMFLLSCCHSAGELAGIVAGPGRSPARLR